MPATTAEILVSQRHRQTRQRAHPTCRLCGPAPAEIPRLDFQAEPDGTVCATFRCGDESTGFPGRIHGGIAAAICDAAMCNALFAAGVAAVTAKLELRFRQPIALGAEAVVRAWLQGPRGGAWWLQAEIRQGDAIAVEASSLFMLPPGGAP